MDSSRLHKMGWLHSYNLGQGLSVTYQHFLKSHRPSNNTK